jgi:hypothetical protein
MFMDWSGAHAVVDAGIHARKADLHLAEPPVQRYLPPTGGDWAA